MFKKDGWVNTLTGLGTRKDKKTRTTYKMASVLDRMLLSELYVNEGLISNIVDTPADDSIKNGVYINNDDDNKIKTRVKDINLLYQCNMALRWSRLYGGGFVVVGIDDGQKLDQPVNKNRIKNVRYLKAFDRHSAVIYPEKIITDPNNANYGELEILQVIPRHGTTFNVHIDRLLMFKGREVPEYLDTGEFFYWGCSEIQKVYETVQGFGTGLSSIITLLNEFTYGVFEFENLAQMMAEGKEKLVKDRIEIIDYSKSMINSVILGKGESFRRETISFAGIPEIIDRLMMLVSGVTGIPVTKLFGRSSAGLNSTGQGDQDNYYDLVKGIQSNKLENNIQKVVDYISLSSELKIKADNPTIQFNSLYQKTDKEELEEQKLQADIDQIYISNGVLDPEEVATNRFTAGGFSYEMTL
jgi:phage-related protein (TIGR01555 family)